ncbi:MAG: YlbF family regulator [Clostridia bacterium]|nr:YlbF family regulator [Clostridia bacterium]
MHELKTYLELSEKVKADKALMELIDAYQTETKQLMDLIQDPNYDAQEAIRLTNDVEYMSGQISSNALYAQFVAAKDALDKALREKAIMSMPCDCNCSTCKQECESREDHQ